METIIKIIGEFLARDGRLILAIGAFIYISYALEVISKTEDFLRLLTKIQPNSAQSHLDLGLHLEDDEPQEAESEIRQAIAFNPKLRSSYYALAWLLLSQNDRLGDAQQTVKQMMELFPEDAMVYTYQGILFESQKSYAEAEKAYRKAIKTAPSLSWPYLCLGNLLSDKTSNYVDAELAYKQAIKNNPTDSRNDFNLARVFARTGRYTEAIGYFSSSIRKNPKYAPAHILLGRFLMATNRRGEAKETLLRAVKIQPKSAIDELNLGDLLRQLKLFTEAENTYRRAIDKDPNLADAYNALGLFLNEEFNRNEEAERLYRQGLNINSDDRNLNYNLALLLRQTQREREAIPFLRQAVKADPKDFDSYMSLASIEKMRGDRKAFLEDAEKARPFIPSDDYYDLSCLENICDNKDLALQYLRKAAQQDEFDPVWAWRDPDLQSLRDDHLFAEIVGPQPDPDLEKQIHESMRGSSGETKPNKM
jgi:tetratricopeptide (TPR) repeat protein